MSSMVFIITENSSDFKCNHYLLNGLSSINGIEKRKNYYLLISLKLFTPVKNCTKNSSFSYLTTFRTRLIYKQLMKVLQCFPLFYLSVKPTDVRKEDLTT